ncbi:MAG: hypothetical protein WBB31_02250 [Saprospiraceae bacterium]
MKNRLIIHILFLILASAIVGESQSIGTNLPEEKVSLITDRTLYIAGEKIHIAAFVSNDFNRFEPGQVLYAEIISSTGTSFSKSKLSVLNKEASGCLEIPEDIVTGVYYVRAYTKYMRNFGPAGYAYIPVKIVNPLSDDVLNGSDNSVFISPTQGHSFSDKFEISTDKNEYAPRESVNVGITNLRLSSAAVDRVSKVSISVIPEFAFSDFTLSLQASDLKSAITYYPETRGVSLTGQLKETVSGKTKPDNRINLSIIGEGRDYMATQTDTAGRFFFSLPAYTGRRDLFLCTAKDDSTLKQLLVDNDFCSLPVHLPAAQFNLSSEERATAYRMALNVRIQHQFDKETLQCPRPFENDMRAFYGTPSDVIRLDNYVALPTLEEYFNELAGAVNVKKKNGHKYFKILGTQPEMSYYDPLVLVDYVAISNPDKILTATPTSIDRIEVIKVPYVKGDITYGGIVSIISKKGDFGGIDLPASGIFINYLFLSDTCRCKISDKTIKDMPDTRNTLYWNSEFALDDKGKGNFSFSTPDTPGRYVIVVRGVDGKGAEIKQDWIFEVKDNKQ